jgi:hypothetical protein
MPAVIRRSEMEKLSNLMDQYINLQANRRFEVQEKIMICESTSFTKHISSDFDVLTVIVCLMPHERLLDEKAFWLK